MQRVKLSKDLTAAIRSGHPWIYRRALRALDPSLRAGDIVAVELDREPIALGFVDPASPIAVRVLSVDVDARIDAAWRRRCVERACAARESISGTNAMRLVHGENDYAPGLVIDRYDDAGVIRYDGAGAEAMWRPHEAALLAAAGVCAPDREVIRIEEHGARFDVDIARGQKTGFFLDQRDNRVRVRALAAGRTVLNLFCYTGGFSIHASLGGAQQVTSVDQARPAMAMLAGHVALNELDAGSHELITGDAFRFLEGAAEAGRAWDVVVCDPPSFAPSEKAKPKALRAYRRLNQLAAAVVAPGGALVSASCSSHVTMTEMLGVLAACGRRLRVVKMCGAGEDHPVAPGFPEGAYLKCLFALVE